MKKELISIRTEKRQDGIFTHCNVFHTVVIDGILLTEEFHHSYSYAPKLKSKIFRVGGHF